MLSNIIKTFNQSAVHIVLYKKINKNRINADEMIYINTI